jgi:hypothetical protein
VKRFVSFSLISQSQLSQEFKKLADPLLSHPIQLWKYRLEFDPRLNLLFLRLSHFTFFRKFGSNHSSISKSLRGAATGQDEFSFATLLSSDYDLKLAVQKFRFALCPKVL